jgi:hypothetical protein
VTGAAPVRVPGFVVIGGGEAGAAYVRQLLRASAAGRLVTERIVVVDRDPACAAGRAGDARVRLDVADWSDWLDAHLEGCGSEDHLVPYHWAPHLLREWLAHQLASRGGRVSPGPVPGGRGLPFESLTAAGDRALSYAAWTCPPFCIEPALCPHTRGPKDWSLAADLESPTAGDAVADRVVLACLHLVYGVGTIPLRAIRAARDRMLAGLDRPRAWLVATSSHCHALASVLRVDPPG